LNERSTIRLSQRLITAAVLVALSGILAACADQVGNFDPTDMLDWMDSKKKLPGDRKPVFPDGVPGLEQGVPKQLYKGTAEQQQIDQQNAQAAAAAAPPPAEEPKSKGKKSKAKQPAAAPAAEADAPGEADGAAAAMPADPKPKKIVRKRTTAPPPDQPAGQAAQPAQPSQPSQQSAAPFPAPLPGASATR
jgi:hypothetical protein